MKVLCEIPRFSSEEINYAVTYKLVRCDANAQGVDFGFIGINCVNKNQINMPFVDGLNCFSVDLYPRSLLTLKDALHYMMHHQESR